MSPRALLYRKPLCEIRAGAVTIGVGIHVTLRLHSYRSADSAHLKKRHPEPVRRREL